MFGFPDGNDKWDEDRIFLRIVVTGMREYLYFCVLNGNVLWYNLSLSEDFFVFSFAILNYSRLLFFSVNGDCVTTSPIRKIQSGIFVLGFNFAAIFPGFLDWCRSVRCTPLYRAQRGSSLVITGLRWHHCPCSFTARYWIPSVLALAQFIGQHLEFLGCFNTATMCFVLF